MQIQLKGKSQGFTLIELLVVIGVIAVLIAVMTPSLAGANDKARRTTCAANLRSLASAQHAYSMDHGDRLPNLNYPNTAVDTQGATKALVNLYAGYANSPKVFYCPSDNDRPPTDVTTADFLTPNSARTSYDFYSIYWMPEKGPKWSQLTRAPMSWDQVGGATVPDVLQNHGVRGGNVSFGDGHAEWQGVKEWDRPNWPHPADRYYQ
jgi:prepilin-type N-terminal cleavage/methylation domain-containing protein/prepilin-type processing-associated H-X9-DG protein